MVLDYVSISFLLNILISNAQILTIFLCVCIDIDTIKVGIGMHDFPQIFSRLMLIGIFMHTWHFYSMKSAKAGLYSQIL